jgi:hypothetical protein
MQLYKLSIVISVILYVLLITAPVCGSYEFACETSIMQYIPSFCSIVATWLQNVAQSEDVCLSPVVVCMTLCVVVHLPLQ